MAAVVSLHDGNGLLVGDFEIKSLSTEVAPLSAITKSIYFRVMFNNLSQNTSSTKTRGEVTCSKRKPWKQKGTGRARVGAASSPLWRSGGILFGPRPGGKTLEVNRKVSKLVWQAVFADLVILKKMICLDLGDSFGVSTMKARNLLGSIVGKENVLLTKFVLLIAPTIESIEISKSFRNMNNVVIEFFDRKDIRSFATSDVVLFLKSDAELFEEMVERHGNN